MSQKSVKLSDLDARFREGVSALQTLKNLAPDAATAMAEKLYSSFLFKLFDAEAVEYDKAGASKYTPEVIKMMEEELLKRLIPEYEAALAPFRRSDAENLAPFQNGGVKLAVTKDGDLEFKEPTRKCKSSMKCLCSQGKPCPLDKVVTG